MARKNNTILRNTSYLGLSTLVSYGLLFFSTVFIARRLGPDSFGMVSFAQILGIYLCLLTDGMKLFGVREIARKGQKDVQNGIQKNFNNLLLVSVLLLLVSAFLLLIYPIESDYKILLISTVFGSMVMASVYVDWIFQGHEMMFFVAVANFLRYSIYVAMVVLFVYMEPSIKWVGIATLLSSVIASGYLFFNLKKVDIGLSFNIRISGLLSDLGTVKTQFVLGMTSLRNQVFYAPVTFILGLQGCHAAAGHFNAAFKVSFFLGALGNVYMQSVFPRVCSYCGNGTEQLNVFVNRSTRLLVYVLLPIGFGGTLLAGKLIALIFGPEYQTAAEIFKVLIWSILVMLMTYNFSAILIGHNRQDLFIKIILAVSVFNVLANMLLLKYFSGGAAAWVSLVSEILALFALAGCCRKLFKVTVRWNIVVPMAGSLLMSGILLALDIDNLFGSILTGALVYLVFIQLFSEISFRELLRLEC